MSERIVIEFEDEDKNPKQKKDEDRIIIDFDKEKKIVEIEELQETNEKKITTSVINSFYRGDSGLSNSFSSDIKFPEGIEQGFRRKFSKNLKEEFFNSVLENNKYIILTSRSGNLYFLDRFTGAVKEKIFFEDESFEKTGIVIQNTAYLNSLNKIYRIRESSDGKISKDEIYSSEKNFIIWSNLNLYKENIVLIEFNPGDNRASLKVIKTDDTQIVNQFNFEIRNFVSDRICIAGGIAYIMTDHSLLVFDLEKMTGSVEPVNLKIDENSFIFYLNYRIYITTLYYELYYLDIPAVNYNFKNTGIKNSYINSIGGFDDNIFAGTLEGWKFYKSSGLQVYNFEDEYENKIECISKNVLAVSQKNKIVFCNLNRFQEAEGYVIASNEKNESVEIVSAVFSIDTIFVLTGNGIIEAFANDKLNIHI